MPKTLLKDILVEIRHSFGRFLSLSAIVALGVAFFAGIKASAPDMKNSADWYFDTYNMQDIQVYSTAGLDEEDVKAIAALDGVEKAQPQFSLDALATRKSRQLSVRVLSLQPDQSINEPRLVEGRMPEEPDECLIEADSATSKLFGTYDLGDRVRLYSGTDTPLEDALSQTTFIVVGKAYNPNYLSYEKGSTDVGSGSLDTFIYVPQKAIRADYYTEIDVTVKNAKEKNTYSDAYFDTVDRVSEEIESIADGRIKARIASQQKKLDDARKEMDDQLSDAKKALDAGKKTLDQSAKEIADGLQAITQGKAQLASSKEQLAAGWASYNQNKAALESGLSQVNAGIDQIEKAQAQLPALQSQKQQLETALRMLPVLNNGLSMIERLQAQYADLKEQLEALQQENPQDPGIQAILDAMQEIEAQLDSLIASLTEDPSMTAQQAIAALRAQRDQILDQIGNAEQGQKMLDQLNQGIEQIQSLDGQLVSLKRTKAQLLAGQSQLNAARQTLEDAQAQYGAGLLEISENEQKLEEGQKELKAGEEEWKSGMDEYEQKKKEGEEQIDQAQEKIDVIDGKWIVLDRMSHYSARDYQACADRMDGIASVFPVFFFLVAALVCMTTMTRMVDEQRSEIGTLKALGYSKGLISLKYLGYAGLASILGSIIGCAAGMVIFPYIIFTAWNAMYNLEAIRFVWQPGLALLASGSVIAVVLGATALSIGKELREVPAALMRPKAGKAGKKILLERIPWFWQKLSFMHKITLRNLFRYKKRFLMTVIGIAGCSALLVAGFGLNDSISDIVIRQFDAIYHYNATVSADLKENPDFASQLAALDNVSEISETGQLPVTVRYDNKDVSATLNIIDDPAGFDDFMSFLSMEGKPMHLDDAGAFVSVKTAEKMGLSKGDFIAFKTTDGNEIQVPVTGIFEQYIDHQIYVTSAVFKQWNLKETPHDVFLMITDNTDPEAESELGAKIMDLSGASSLVFYTSLRENFMNMIASIKIVVFVLVLSAAMLAFVVLYNLSNVNISERLREIATIKVLGFTEKETNAYINRESIALSLIGAVCGLGLGVWLHGMIMNLAEMDNIRFGRTINWTSFALALVLTMLFTFAVNWIMKFHIRKIEMVESLKAVE